MRERLLLLVALTPLTPHSHVCSLQVKKETSTVVLNTANLELGAVSVLVTPAGGAAPHTMEASSRDFDETFERGLFSFPGALPAGATARRHETNEKGR